MALHEDLMRVILSKLEVRELLCIESSSSLMQRLVREEFKQRREIFVKRGVKWVSTGTFPIPLLMRCGPRLKKIDFGSNNHLLDYLLDNEDHVIQLAKQRPNIEYFGTFDA